MLQENKPLHIMYHLLMTVVCSTGVSKVLVLNVVATEETMFSTDVSVTGTVERQQNHHTSQFQVSVCSAKTVMFERICTLQVIESDITHTYKF